MQTVIPALAGPRMLPQFKPQRLRWNTPDQDFIDVDVQRALVAPDTPAPLLVLFHGLEGNAQSHYARAFAASAARAGWSYAVAHFRGCSGEMNLAPRAYHSGDFEEIDWILQQFATAFECPLAVVGVSLGGNALLRWAQECGGDSRYRVKAIASVGAPLDLAASGAALSRGLNRYLYTPMFLRTMKPKAMRKWRQYPGLFDAAALMAADDLYAFDNVFTAPLHGFKNTDDYWQRASAAPRMPAIALPSLVVNAQNDPFVPIASLPAIQTLQQNRYIEVWRPRHGGHIGFWQGPSAATMASDHVLAWLTRKMGI